MIFLRTTKLPRALLKKRTYHSLDLLQTLSEVFEQVDRSELHVQALQQAGEPARWDVVAVHQGAGWIRDFVYVAMAGFDFPAIFLFYACYYGTQIIEYLNTPFL